MYKLDEVKNLIIKSDTKDLPDNFVAAAVKVNSKGVPYHAGLVIGYSGEVFLFHYTGEYVDLNYMPIGDWYFHNYLEFITEDEVAAFYNHCKIIKEEAKPTYGYFYPGSFYDQSGTYFSENGLPEIMTCVSFCLNVILGFIESDEYISFEDWNTANQTGAYRVFHNWQSVEDKDAEEYVDYFIKTFSDLVKGVDLNILKGNLRRIYPIEYFSASYVKNLPIRKAEVDLLVPLIEQALTIKRAS